MSDLVTKEQIQRLRDDLGLSQPKFGDLVGVSGNYIWKLENGRDEVKPGPLNELLKLYLRLHGGAEDLSRARLTSIEKAAQAARDAGELVSLDPVQVQAMVDELLRRRASA